MRNSKILIAAAMLVAFTSCSKQDVDKQKVEEQLTSNTQTQLQKPAVIAAAPAPPAGETWQLVESDDFDSFNTAKWGHGGTPWGTESHDGQCNIQTAEDSWASNGSLMVRARKGPITGPSGKSYPYAGSYVWTKTSRTYGYLEIRAKYPNIQGGWPAFWMLGQGWPPEIDIAEYRGAPKSYMTIAYYDGGWSSTTRQGDYTQWHTYGLLWQKGLLKFFIDGEVVKTVDKSPDVPMYVILSNGVDCSAADNTGFPNNYEVDYFHWYQSVPSGDINGVYEIVNRNSNKCLTPLNSSSDDGTPVVQWDCDGNALSRWKVTPVSPGVYTIVNNSNSKYADVSNASTTAGTNNIIWPNTGGNNQRWNIIDLGNGYYNIKNVNSGLLLDIYGASTANNANNIQWSPTGGNNQQWTFRKI